MCIRRKYCFLAFDNLSDLCYQFVPSYRVDRTLLVPKYNDCKCQLNRNQVACVFPVVVGTVESLIVCVLFVSISNQKMLISERQESHF